MLNNKGYTLTELVIVMGIFIAIIIMSTYAFDHLLASSSQQAKSTESNIEGVVGLELLRSDIEHAGYGVPWTFQNWSAVRYKEVDVTNNILANGVDSNSFNPTTASNIPVIQKMTSTAAANILSGTSNTNPGIDYLVIRSATVGMNDAAKKWSYVNYSSSGGNNASYIKQWGRDDLVNNDLVVTISSTFTASGSEDKRLVMNIDSFSYPVNGTAPPDNAYKPGDASQMYIVYGVSHNNSAGATLRMPYNRADYYVKKPAEAKDMPSMCNPGTGVLYKATAIHSSGGFDQYPLLDCVGDMQVEFELDRESDGNTTFSPVLTITDKITGATRDMTAQEIRTQLKNVRVYILTHEGQKDTSFTYGGASIQVGDPKRPASSGRTWTSANMQSAFGTDWKNYRWKVYTLVVRPKNLN